MFTWNISNLKLLKHNLENSFLQSPKVDDITQTLQEHIYEWKGEQSQKQQQMISNLPRNGKLVKSTKLSESSIELSYEWEVEK